MKHKTKKLVYNIITCIIIIVTLVWVCSKFVHLGNVEFTENAQVKQHIVSVNARVQGFVKEIRFEEYAEVKKGDTLLVIEPAEFNYRLAQAKAAYLNAIADKQAMKKVISTTNTNLAVTEASIKEANIHLANAERNYKRFEKLLAQSAVTRQQYDDVKTHYEAAKARCEMLNQQKRSIEAVRAEQTTRLDQNEAGIRVAEASLELARLNLSYTVIVAPADGVTGRKDIHEGQLVQPGQCVVDIVSHTDKWIMANYKERQIANIKVGNEVEIEVDAVGGHKFKGVVTSISGATGASFSLIPQDNSSGNFVKIEQRIPVRIDFVGNDEEMMRRVGAGMNVECKVLY
ncbi:MAG: HlyD family secretion protein [Rikenellaceae bacterium]|nr:HlyD family secretion protein [Rikenellaceae bacterium]